MKGVLASVCVLVLLLCVAEAIRPKYMRNNEQKLDAATFANPHAQSRNWIDTIITCDQCQQLVKIASNLGTCVNYAETELHLREFDAQIACSYLGSHVSGNPCSKIFTNCA
eukprot:TRINITY_DN310_c0_g1_i1.p1 TRINITY_DN310_c0_g1~~TRINITY_DN310_c0_g1_i1.p1  ORF type:complete len:111 (-),score=11.10 TRINITY_DN310_c0_g1_i1:74-406(-)